MSDLLTTINTLMTDLETMPSIHIFISNLATGEITILTGIFWLAVASVISIIGGAIGNVVDKLTLGYVIDFIDLYVSSWHFATFNLADACISIGAVLLCYESILNQK